MTEPVKRGRGRPPKLDANGQRIVVEKSSTGLKRGRPSSTGPKVVKAPKEAAIAVEETESVGDAAKGKGKKPKA